MKKLLTVFLAIGFLALGAAAQTTPPPVSTPTGYPFAVSGTYASSSGNATNNGMQNTVEWNMAGRWGARIDLFNLNNPAMTTLSLAVAQYKVPGNRLFKTANPTFANLVLGVHAGPGVLKSPSGALSFAAGAGVSVDYNPTSIFFVRVLDVTYAYSRGLGNNGIVLGNYVSAGAGFGFRF